MKNRTDLSHLLAPKNPMNDPLVTILTPTWDNREVLFNKCIPSVRKQTYRYLEHIVIGDGIDFDLRRELDKLYYFKNYVELGRRWSEIDNDEKPFYGAIEVGIYLAKGQYIMLLPDNKALEDETLIKNLVKDIQETKNKTVEKGDFLLAEINSASILLT